MPSPMSPLTALMPAPVPMEMPVCSKAALACTVLFESGQMNGAFAELDDGVFAYAANDHPIPDTIAASSSLATAAGEIQCHETLVLVGVQRAESGSQRQHIISSQQRHHHVNAAAGPQLLPLSSRCDSQPTLPRPHKFPQQRARGSETAAARCRASDDVLSRLR